GTPIAVRGSETVLVVEDQEEVRQLTKRVLEARGYAVLAARNGAEALGMFARHPTRIHLMITDVVMPGMNGRELAELACAKRSDLKVLYVSGYTGEAVLQHRLLQPGVAFLQKPFTPDALAHKTREVLDNAKQLPRPWEPLPPVPETRTRPRSAAPSPPHRGPPSGTRASACPPPW